MVKGRGECGEIGGCEMWGSERAGGWRVRGCRDMEVRERVCQKVIRVWGGY